MRKKQHNQQTQAPDQCQTVWWFIYASVVLPCPLRWSSQCGFGWVKVLVMKKKLGPHNGIVFRTAWWFIYASMVLPCPLRQLTMWVLVG